MRQQPASRPEDAIVAATQRFQAFMRRFDQGLLTCSVSPPTQSLQTLLSQHPTSSESQSLTHFLSLPPSPQSTSCTEPDGWSDVSMDHDHDNHESVLDCQDVFLYPSCPVQGLPDSRLCGRHFMAKTEHRRRCTLCTKSEPRGSPAYESKISLICKNCGVFLHFDCFEEYHTKTHPVSQWMGDV
jgi:hypothetical protein